MDTMNFLQIVLIASAIINILLILAIKNDSKYINRLYKWSMDLYADTYGRRMQFSEMQFSKDMQVCHKGKTCDIISVDFYSDLVGVKMDNSNTLSWLRCEECEFLTNNK